MVRLIRQDAEGPLAEFRSQRPPIVIYPTVGPEGANSQTCNCHLLCHRYGPRCPLLAAARLPLTTLRASPHVRCPLLGPYTASMSAGPTRSDG